MSEPIYLRYTPIDGEPQHEVELRTIGESLVGFARVAEEYARILGIRGNLVLSVTYTREGSLIFDLLVDLQQCGDLVFETAQQLYDFLKISSAENYQTALNTLGQLKDGYETLEDYYAKHPIQLTAIVAAIAYLIGKTAKQKDQPQINDPELPRRIAEMLHELVKTKAFRKFLEPIIQDTARSIEISERRDFKKAAEINQSNIQDYLPDEEMILPHLLPDTQHTLDGTITSMKSTRGDSLTFQYFYEGKAYNLDLLPEPDRTTKAYTDFYKEQVNTKVTVIRDSMFKKPKLRIDHITHLSPYLFEESDAPLQLENRRQIEDS